MSLLDFKLNHFNEKYKEIEPNISSHCFMDRKTILFLLEKLLKGDMDAYSIYMLFMLEPLAKDNKNFLLYVLNHFLENYIARCAIIIINFCLLDDDECCIDDESCIDDILQEMIDEDCLHAIYLKGCFFSNQNASRQNKEDNKYWQQASSLKMALATSKLAQNIVAYSSIIQLNQFEWACQNLNSEVLNEICNTPVDDILYEKKINLLLEAINQGDKIAYLYLGDHYNLMKDKDLAITYYQNYLYFLEEWHMLLKWEVRYINKLLSELKKSK